MLETIKKLSGTAFKKLGGIAFKVDPYEIAGVYHGDKLVSIIDNSDGSIPEVVFKKPGSEVVKHSAHMLTHGDSFILQSHFAVRYVPTTKGLFAYKKIDDLKGSIEQLISSQRFCEKSEFDGAYMITYPTDMFAKLHITDI